MWISHVEIDVAGVEFAKDWTLSISFGHATVAIVLKPHGKCAMFGKSLAISHASEIGGADVFHIVHAHLVVKFRSQKRRVLLHKVDVVVDDGEVVSAKPIHMRRRAHVEKFVSRGAVLRPRRKAHSPCGKQADIAMNG